MQAQISRLISPQDCNRWQHYALEQQLHYTVLDSDPTRRRWRRVEAKNEGRDTEDQNSSETLDQDLDC